MWEAFWEGASHLDGSPSVHGSEADIQDLFDLSVCGASGSQDCGCSWCEVPLWALSAPWHSRQPTVCVLTGLSAARGQGKRHISIVSPAPHWTQVLVYFGLIQCRNGGDRYSPWPLSRCLRFVTDRFFLSPWGQKPERILGCLLVRQLCFKSTDSLVLTCHPSSCIPHCSCSDEIFPVLKTSILFI